MRKIVFIAFLACLLSCEKNFDEEKDTNQRKIEFHVGLSEFFSNVLLAEDNHFRVGNNIAIPQSSYIRVTAYCYDASGRLEASNQHLVQEQDGVNFVFRHLRKDEKYRFLFLADVVSADDNLVYRETWYQLETKQWQTFFLLATEPSENVVGNVLEYAELEQAPDNQLVEVDLSPFVLNGYLLLTHTENIDRAQVTLDWVSSFFLEHLNVKKHSCYSKSAAFPQGKDIVCPLYVTRASNHLPYTISLTGAKKGQMAFEGIISMEYQKPFVATFDCQTCLMTDMKYY